MYERYSRDLRMERAQIMASTLMNALNPWIERLDRLQTWAEQSQAIDEKRAEVRPPDPRREIHRALMEILCAVDVEVITDADRIRAGLEPRNERGLTDTELHVIETRLTEAMLRPMTPLYVEPQI